MRAICGEINRWHWTQTNLNKCDILWETETVWHRDCINHFPIQNQEVIHINEFINASKGSLHKSSGIMVNKDENLFFWKYYYRSWIGVKRHGSIDFVEGNLL